MSMRRVWLALALVVGVSTSGTAGEVNLTVVNVVTPQDVKICEPTSLFAKKLDIFMLNLINPHQDEHGSDVAAVGVKEVVEGGKSKDVKFTADKAGIFPIKCHLHPAHVVGQLVVL